MIWWLSFAGEQGNLGVAIVEADEFANAVSRAHDLGINPGGQVRGVLVPEDEPEALAEVKKLGFNRLISTDELKALDYKTERERMEAS